MHFIQRILLSALIFFGLGGTLTAQTTWTGSVSTDWNTAGNWSAGVPDANDDVTIPDVANDPVISASAWVRSVTVQTGGVLTITTAGSITIEGASSDGLVNRGTVQNNGSINIGNNAPVGLYGLRNFNLFYNNAGATIIINRATGSESILLDNEAGSSFTNAGSIRMGTTLVTANYGIYNLGSFENSAGGSISIDRVAHYGIGNQSPFTNRGIINIGTSFTQSTTQNAIWNMAAAALFTNAAGGKINIDQSLYGIWADGGAFDNLGTLKFGATYHVSHLIFCISPGVVNNKTGGVIDGAGSIEYLNSAGGTLSPNNNTPGSIRGVMSFDNDADLSNSVITLDVYGKGTAGVDYDQLTVSGTATLGGTLAVSIGYTPAIGDQITLVSATAVSGTFSSITGLPAGWGVYYLPNAAVLTYGQEIWTGNVSTDWNTAGNWLLNTVPAASQNVIIPDVTNDPVIGAAGAVARSVSVQGGGSLTVAATGTLSISGSTAEALVNRGTVQNNGSITIASLAAGSTYGVYNTSAFTIAAGATLNIDGVSASGTAIWSSGVFTNSGAIAIGGNSASGSYGIDNSNIFKNSGGLINIDRITTTGIRNITINSFDNAGVIVIGANAAFGATGIEIQGPLNNFSGSRINIDQVTGAGISIAGTYLQNLGTINIGTLAGGNTFPVGIYNNGTYYNYGQLYIDRVQTGLSLNNGMQNSGSITIGQVAGVATLISGARALVNSTNGIIHGTGRIASSAITNSGGTLAPGYTGIGKMSFYGTQVSFANSIINIRVNGTAVAGIDYDQIVEEDGKAIMGGKLSLSINYTPVRGDRITIVKGVPVSGSLMPIGSLPANWRLVYGTSTIELVFDDTPALTEWTGNVSSDWNVSGNWSAGVPGAISGVNIGANPVNMPVISDTTAIARYVNVNGGTLTIANTGALALNASPSTALYNAGTVQNSGKLNIGNLSAVGTYGINNFGTFTNNTGAVINIDRTGQAIANFSGKTFTNAGTVNIGANAAAGTTGIDNGGVFNNNTGGRINIDRVNIAIIANAYVFTNAGSITVGALGGIDTLLNNTGSGTFNNASGGILKGSGSIEATKMINDGGSLAPGVPVGIMTFNGDEDLSNNTLAIDINGKNTAGADFDEAVVKGNATLGGALALSVNYTPADGDSVTILSATAISGTFASVTGLPANWKAIYTANAVLMVFDTRVYWTGNVSAAWNTGGNWAGGVVPGAGKSVVLPATGVTREMTVNNGISTGSIEIAAGRTVTIGAAGSFGATNKLINNGTIKGTGTIVNPNFTNTGILSPGNSPGILRVTGNFINQGTIEAEIGGTTAGTQYDQLAVTGAVTIGGTLTVSTVNGFALAGGQSFDIVTGSSITGTFTAVNLPAGISGSVTYSGTAATLNIITTLPLRLVEFTGQRAGAGVVLHWKTAEEENTSVFEVERSSDGVNFSRTATIAAIGSGANSYSSTDGHPLAGNNYYRLKMVDIDGKFTYSKIVVVGSSDKASLQISPIPAISFIRLSVTGLAGQHAQVYNTAGFLITDVILADGGVIDISRWSTGIYFIKTNNGTYRFIKQ